VDHGGEVGSDVGSDLVEYLVIRGADEGALAELAGPLARLVDEGTVRVLDLVVVVRHDDGRVVVRDVVCATATPVFRRLVEAGTGFGGLLSADDILQVSTAVRPGSAALVLVVEDLWAAPLSAAARRACGRIVAGERICTSRIGGLEADRVPRQRGDPRGAVDDGRPPARSLLARPPLGDHPPGRGDAGAAVDPIEQIRELADLRQRGLLSDDDVERLKERVLGRRS
jgi:hypothetical protein